MVRAYIIAFHNTFTCNLVLHRTFYNLFKEKLLPQDSLGSSNEQPFKYLKKLQSAGILRVLAPITKQFRSSLLLYLPYLIPNFQSKLIFEDTFDNFVSQAYNTYLK